MIPEVGILNFDLLDDVCLACETGGLNADNIPKSSADSLGPLMELMHILPRISTGSSNSVWLSNEKYSELIRQWAQASSWFCPSALQGLISVSKLQQDDLAQPDLYLRLKRAATTAGFTNDHGAKITAAIGEIYDNVIEHSGRVDTAYVAYSAQTAIFEFVVADHGIGVLESLRTNPRYADTPDAGSALEKALGDGVSRYVAPGRGSGFRPLLVGLANISRTIRFRSGNYGRMLIRRPDGTIQATTTQLSNIDGFFCAVSCDTNV